MHYYPHQDEKQRHVSSIIVILNDTDAQLKELNALLASRNRVFSFVLQDATLLIEKFFYNCQIAEQRIKQGYRKGYLTKKQVEDLNKQLNTAVRTMVEISRQSESVTQILREKFGADVIG
jgi:methyl-accepting chemotaxis protein